MLQTVQDLTDSKGVQFDIGFRNPFIRQVFGAKTFQKKTGGDHPPGNCRMCGLKLLDNVSVSLYDAHNRERITYYFYRNQPTVMI